AGLSPMIWSAMRVGFRRFRSCRTPAMRFFCIRIATASAGFPETRIFRNIILDGSIVCAFHSIMMVVGLSLGDRGAHITWSGVITYCRLLLDRRGMTCGIVDARSAVADVYVADGWP